MAVTGRLCRDGCEMIMPMKRNSRTRLTPERELEVYQVVLSLVRDQGFDVMTMDAVSTRAKISKATLYRQWQSKPRLVAAALRATKPVTFQDIDTGSLRGDLMTMADQVGDGLDEDAVLMAAIGHAVQRDEELGDVLREVLVQPEMEAVRRMLDRAVARGEVRADAPAGRFLQHMLFGALPARKFLDNAVVDGAYLADYIDAVVLPALRYS